MAVLCAFHIFVGMSSINSAIFSSVILLNIIDLGFFSFVYACNWKVWFFFPWCPTLLYVLFLFHFYFSYSLLIWSRSSILSSSHDVLSSAWFSLLVRLSFEFESWVIGFFKSISILPLECLCILIEFSCFGSSSFLLAFLLVFSWPLRHLLSLSIFCLVSMSCFFVFSLNSLILLMKFIIFVLNSVSWG